MSQAFRLPPPAEEARQVNEDGPTGRYFARLRHLVDSYARGDIGDEQLEREFDELADDVMPKSALREVFRRLFPSLKRSR